MLRPMVATTAVTAALILLAGCGGDDKKSDAGSDNNGGTNTASSTPSAPAAPTFDPPKAFALGAAYPVMKEEKQTAEDKSQMAIAGKVAVVSNLWGLTGHDVTDRTKTWTVKPTEAETTEVFEVSKPMAAKVDGKDVAVIAYAEADKGGGTTKPSGQIVIQWIDVATGQKVSEVTAKVSTLGQAPGQDSAEPRIKSQAYDPETGQVAIGFATSGSLEAKETVYADPTTKKFSIIQDLNPAAVHAGVVAGAKGEVPDSHDSGTALLADGATGKVTKQIPLKQYGLTPLVGGANYAYFYGSAYTDYDNGINTDTIFAVNLKTGAVVPTTPTTKFESDSGLDCLWDQASTVVCRVNSIRSGPVELIGFDDATGKKAWGFATASGNRVAPEVTAAFHGVIYAETEAQNVLLDAKTGQDLPSASSSTSPSSSDTPSSGDSPSSEDSPSGEDSPGDGNLGLFDGKMQSPEAVSTYGAVYRQAPPGNDYSTIEQVESICIFLKATA